MKYFVIYSDSALYVSSFYTQISHRRVIVAHAEFTPNDEVIVFPLKTIFCHTP